LRRERAWTYLTLSLEVLVIMLAQPAKGFKPLASFG
jgi:hypothetical protein